MPPSASAEGKAWLRFLNDFKDSPQRHRAKEQNIIKPFLEYYFKNLCHLCGERILSVDQVDQLTL